MHVLSLNFVVIQKDLSWSVILPRGIPIPYDSSILQQVLAKLEDIPSVISLFNAATICQGNCNDKYHVLSKIRDGIYLDHKSLYTVSYNYNASCKVIL